MKRAQTCGRIIKGLMNVGYCNVLHVNITIKLPGCKVLIKDIVVSCRVSHNYPMIYKDDSSMQRLINLLIIYILGFALYYNQVSS